MFRYFLIACLGVALIYLASQMNEDPNLITALALILGILLSFGGAFAMRVKGYDEILKNKNRQTELESYENASIDDG
jgi:hypothetical protein